MCVAEPIRHTAADKSAIHRVANGRHAEGNAERGAMSYKQNSAVRLRTSVQQVAAKRVAGLPWQGQML